MNVFDSDFASSLIADDTPDEISLTAEQKDVVEESVWEQIQQAVDQGELCQDDADLLIYQLHSRFQLMGDFSLRAS